MTRMYRQLYKRERFKSRQIASRVTEEAMEIIYEFANEREWSISYLVEVAINDYMKRENKKK